MSPQYSLPQKSHSQRRWINACCHIQVGVSSYNNNNGIIHLQKQNPCNLFINTPVLYNSAGRNWLTLGKRWRWGLEHCLVWHIQYVKDSGIFPGGTAFPGKSPIFPQRDLKKHVCYGGWDGAKRPRVEAVAKPQTQIQSGYGEREGSLPKYCMCICLCQALSLFTWTKHTWKTNKNTPKHKPKTAVFWPRSVTPCLTMTAWKRHLFSF